MRGVTANVAIMEEGSHMDERVLYEVFAPLIGVDKFVILGISTPLGEDCYYSKLMNIKGPDGENIFRSIHLKTVCEECVLAHIEDECTHGTTELPSWKPKKRQKILDALYSTSSEARLTGARETAGVIITGKRLVFEREWVEKLQARSLHSFGKTYKPSVLYTSIDPAGGGSHSEYSIVTTAFQGSSNIIVGCDSTPSGNHNVIFTMIKNHFRLIRAQPLYSNAQILVFIESNYGGGPVVSHLIEQIRQVPDVHPATFQDRIKNKKREFGVWLTKDVKLGYIEQLKVALANNAVCFASEFVSQNTARAKLMIHEQLQGFEHKIKLPNNEFGEPKSVYTGKGGGGKDDIVICLACSIFWMAKKRLDDVEFISRARRLGWRLS